MAKALSVVESLILCLYALLPFFHPRRMYVKQNSRHYVLTLHNLGTVAQFLDYLAGWLGAQAEEEEEEEEGRGGGGGVEKYWMQLSALLSTVYSLLKCDQNVWIIG